LLAQIFWQKCPKKPIFFVFLADFKKTLINQRISRSFTLVLAIKKYE